MKDGVIVGRFPTTSVAVPTWQLLTSENPVFCNYVTHACLLVLKMLLLGIYTGAIRFKKQVFVNPEDLPLGKSLVLHDEDVDRIRLAHRNDLENILPYLFIGFLFVLTEPNVVVSLYLFRLVTITRTCYTLFYAVYPLRKPIHGICFLSTLCITLFMAIDCVVYYTYV